MPLALAIFDGTTGALLDDLSSHATTATFATNEHGCAEARVSVPMPLAPAFRQYDRAGLPALTLTESAAGVLYTGRLEDNAIRPSGIDLSAYGYSQALGDAPYTALWSSTDVGDWQILSGDDLAGTAKDRYTFDTDNRLYISPQKGATFANGTDYGVLGFRRPHGSSRTITGWSFDYEVLLPNNWNVLFQSRDDTWGSGVTLATVVATGALVRGSTAINVGGTGSVVIAAINMTGGASTPAGESGANYVKITNVRVTSTLTNLISTTLGTVIAAGTRTVTPGSMARIFVGQRLVIGGTSESVIVTAITSTTFTAVFANAHGAADTVLALVVYADEIAKDLVATISALNSTQLSSSTALIQSPGIDLQNERYEDRLPSDILDYLIGLGDNQTPPNQWEWGVWEDQRLHVWPRGTNARAWYVDATELEVERTLSQLHNSVYATYQESGGRTLRSAATSDTASVTRYGLTRRASITADTTSATQAGVQQAAALNDGKDPIPRAKLGFTAVYDAAGGRWPLHAVRSGDTVTIRNLPPTLSNTIDRIRTFRIARTTYDALAGTIAIEPESPLPTLTAMLARGRV